MPGPAKRAIFIKAAALSQSEKYSKKFDDAQTEETGASKMWIRTFAYHNAILDAASLATQTTGEASRTVSAHGGYGIVLRKPYGAMYGSVISCFSEWLTWLSFGVYPLLPGTLPYHCVSGVCSYLSSVETP